MEAKGSKKMSIVKIVLKTKFQLFNWSRDSNTWTSITTRFWAHSTTKTPHLPIISIALHFVPNNQLPSLNPSQKKIHTKTHHHWSKLHLSSLTTSSSVPYLNSQVLLSKFWMKVKFQLMKVKIRRVKDINRRKIYLRLKGKNLN